MLANGGAGLDSDNQRAIRAMLDEAWGSCDPAVHHLRMCAAALQGLAKHFSYEEERLTVNTDPLVRTTVARILDEANECLGNTTPTT